MPPHIIGLPEPTELTAADSDRGDLPLLTWKRNFLALL